MRKSKSKSMGDKKSSEESESVEDSIEDFGVEELTVIESKPEKPVAKSKPEPDPVKKLKIINQLTQKININVLDENNVEQHVEINAKKWVAWPLVKNLGGQVDTLIRKKMLKVHPFIPE